VNRPFKAHAFILSANIIYGLNYSIAKLALTTLPPFALVLTRVTLPVLVYGAVLKWITKEKVERKDHLAFIYCGLLGVAANQLMFIKGLSLTSEIHASLIMITTPILVMIMSWLILKEKLTWKKILGVLLGASGVYYLVTLAGSTTGSPSSVTGDLLVMANAACYGLYLVLAKPLMAKYSPYTAAFWFFFYGSLFVIPFGVPELKDIPLRAIEGAVFWSWMYVVVITTLVVSVLNMMGLKYAGPTLVSVYIYTQPLIASMVAIAIGNDTLTTAKLLAALLIFSGVALVSFTGRNRVAGKT
jgi:drug/metabolite transporter (DMT)-like permease